MKRGGLHACPESQATARDNEFPRREHPRGLSMETICGQRAAASCKTGSLRCPRVRQRRTPELWRRLHSREDGAMEDRGRLRRKFVSGRCGWCRSTMSGTSLSGPRSARWRPRPAVPPRRSGPGSNDWGNSHRLTPRRLPARSSARDADERGATNHGSSRCPLHPPGGGWNPPPTWRNSGRRRNQCLAATGVFGQRPSRGRAGGSRRLRPRSGA